MSRLPRVERAKQMRDKRRADILVAAVMVAQRDGYRKMTRAAVAREAGVANGSINHAFGSMDALRDEVMAHAVARQNLPIVRQGLADNHPALHNATPELKMHALHGA